MKNIYRKGLDPWSMAIALIMTVEEFEIFTFAKGVVEIAGADAWLSMLLGTILLNIIIWLYVKLAVKFPRENFIQYSSTVWGKGLSTILKAAFLLYWFFFLVLLFKDVSIANQEIFLPNTPLFVTMFLLALGAVWITMYGLPALVRLFQFLFPFFVIPLLLIVILSIRYVDLTNFTPFLSKGIYPVLKGAIFYLGAFQGLEIILFLTPFIDDVTKILKPALVGINIVTLLSFSFMICAVGVMGVENIKDSVWPGINLVMMIELPQFPVERFGLFLTLPWLFGIFTTMCFFIYLIANVFMQELSIKRRKVSTFGIALIIVLSTYLIPNYAWSLSAREYSTYASLAFLYFIPIATLFVLTIFPKRMGKNE